MKQFKPVLFSLLFLSLTFILKAQSSGDENKFSLQQCIDYALAHQSAYLNAQIDEEISKEKSRKF